jgi:hypothetical protein
LLKIAEEFGIDIKHHDPYLLNRNSSDTWTYNPERIELLKKLAGLNQADEKKRHGELKDYFLTYMKYKQQMGDDGEEAAKGESRHAKRGFSFKNVYISA